MTRMLSAGSWSVGLLLSGLAALGCTPGGVGDPCTPEDEYQQGFNGFQVTEVNVESRSFQCETRLCLVNHFQGRVSCPQGQTDTDAKTAPKCSIPGTDPGSPSDPVAAQNNITVQVKPQLVSRQTEQAVYCSCRCDGPDKNARFCECPQGFQCEPLVDDLRITSGGGQLPGSYCIRSNSKYSETNDLPDSPKNCHEKPADCGIN
jgi:hypothetical protein